MNGQNTKVKRAVNLSKEGIESPSFHSLIEVHMVLKRIQSSSVSANNREFDSLKEEIRIMVEQTYPQEYEQEFDRLQNKKQEITDEINTTTSDSKLEELNSDKSNIDSQLKELNQEYSEEIRTLLHQVVEILGKQNR